MAVQLKRTPRIINSYDKQYVSMKWLKTKQRFDYERIELANLCAREYKHWN